MASDPAFLFYSSDFLNGVSDLTMEERGQYITLLCIQHQKGELSDKTIRLCLGSVSVDVLSKFKKNEAGNFFNERLMLEIEKRKSFTESRRNNGTKGGRPKKLTDEIKTDRLFVGLPKVNLMENENEDVNEIEIKDVIIESSVKKNEKLFKENSFIQFWDLYDKKTALKDCEKKFLKLPKEVIEKILEVVPLYVKSTPEKEFRKHPATWLNNECWNDEIIKRNQNGESKSNAEIFHDAINSEIGRGFSYSRKNN